MLTTRLARADAYITSWYRPSLSLNCHPIAPFVAYYHKLTTSVIQQALQGFLTFVLKKSEMIAKVWNVIFL
ncbi:MAG: hypothetical protein PUP91_27270 [Rhizonema sp. PD37]|nr:hypothetical protein [Rhizonema sp. PD37]